MVDKILWKMLTAEYHIVRVGKREVYCLPECDFGDLHAWYPDSPLGVLCVNGLVQLGGVVVPVEEVGGVHAQLEAGGGVRALLQTTIGAIPEKGWKTHVDSHAKSLVSKGFLKKNILVKVILIF